MKRRQLLKYSSLTGLGFFALYGCSDLFTDPNDQNLDGDNSSSSNTTEDLLTRFGILEKTSLNLGFFPSTAAIPLILAKEKGFFESYGLDVTLQRSLHWDELTEQLGTYQLDGSLTPISAPIAAQMNKNYRPMVGLMMMNRHGNSLIFSKDAWENKLRPRKKYTNFLELGRALRSYLETTEKEVTLGVSSTFSTNRYLASYWFGAIGITPKIVDLSPPEIIEALEAGEIDSCMVGEPWTRKIIQDKLGFTMELSQDIWLSHPGDILSVMIPWLEENPHTATAMTAALLESCRFCDRPENIEAMATILARSEYFDLPSALISSNLGPEYIFSELGAEPIQENVPSFNLFYDEANQFLASTDQTNYIWLSHGSWILTQMIRAGQTKYSRYPDNANFMLEKAFNLEFYKEAAKTIGIEIPPDSYRYELDSHFVDNKGFNPSKAQAYLGQFSRLE